MPVEFSVDREDEIVYGTCRGEVTADEIMEGLEKVFTDEGYRPGFRGLTDLRDIRWESNQEDLRRIVQFLIRNRKKFKKHRSAVVVSTERTFGMTRMFEVFSEQTPIKMRVFRDYDEARKWILERDEEEGKDDSDRL